MRKVRVTAEHVLHFNEEDNTLNFIDIDDTLFKTDTKVKVVNKDGSMKRRLSSEEFNMYKLKPGETFDFSEFSDSSIFYQTAKPVKNVLDKVNIMLNNKNNRIIFLTARADMNDKNMFLAVFRKYGIPVDDKSLVYIERAGNLMLRAPIAKRIVIEKYITANRNCNKVRLIDDSEHNLSEFLKLKSKYPDIEFEAIRVTQNGEMEVVKHYISERQVV